jgi:hypothetical protein
VNDRVFRSSGVRGVGSLVMVSSGLLCDE